MVKGEMWQIFRAYLKGFCRLWVQVPSTHAMLQALADEHLWAWFAGLGVAKFLPLRHSCAYISMHLMLAVAAEAKEAYLAAVLGRNVLADYGGASPEDENVGRHAVREQHKKGANMHASGARGVAAAGGRKGGREALRAPTGRKQGDAKMEDAVWMPLQTMSFGDLVRAAHQLRAAGGRVGFGEDAGDRYSWREQEKEQESKAAAGEVRRPAPDEPAHHCGGVRQQHAGVGSCSEAALERFRWLVNCWRQRKHGILRCARRGRDGNGAEVAALLLHVFECAGRRCLVICHADSVHDWRERLDQLEGGGHGWGVHLAVVAAATLLVLLVASCWLLRGTAADRQRGRGEALTKFGDRERADGGERERWIRELRETERLREQERELQHVRGQGQGGAKGRKGPEEPEVQRRVAGHPRVGAQGEPGRAAEAAGARHERRGALQGLAEDASARRLPVRTAQRGQAVARVLQR